MEPCLRLGYHCGVIKLLLTAFALGLASFDITGALLAVGALGVGARTRALVTFGGFCILGTVAFGTALSLIVGPRIAGIDWGMLLPHDPTEDRVAAFVDVVLGVGLLTWGIVHPKARHASAQAERPTRPRSDLTGRRGDSLRVGGDRRPCLRLARGDRRTSRALFVGRRPHDVDVG